MVSPPFVVPATNPNPNLNPKLRFWTWYRFGASTNGFADKGDVEIKQIASTTWTTLLTYTGNSGGTWFQPTIDLSNYAGQTVQIAFRISAGNQGAASGPGWYLDQIQIPSPAAPGIAVQQPVGNGLPNGLGVVSFGAVSLGSSSSKTFTINSTGLAELSLGSLTIDGSDAADFSITTNPGASILPGGSTTFSVNFLPGGLGTRNAVLHIPSNDATQTPFNVSLTGSGSIGSFSLQVSSILAHTTDSAVSVTVLRNFNAPATVAYQTVDDSAIAGTNFLSTQGTLSFGLNELSKTISVPIVYQPTADSAVHFTVQLTSPSAPATINGRASTDVFILNDVLASLSLSNFTTALPGAAPAANGSLQTTLTYSPSGTGGQWRLFGELAWRNSGDIATGLTGGNYNVEFKPTAGYATPDLQVIPVAEGQSAVTVGNYVGTVSPAVGSLSVALSPAGLGGWRLQGETVYRASGATVGNLTTGSYIVEFQPVAGRTTPENRDVLVQTGAVTSVSCTYFIAYTTAGLGPVLVDAAQSRAAAPFIYTGQIQTDNGFGSGFVPLDRVVVTAAHVLFDDGSLSYVGGVRWFFQHERGAFETAPQIPRGSYILEGYASQRAADASPGVSTPASQQLDAAALYFLEPAARGGQCGYLASNSTVNPWMASGRDKFIAGYPVEGVSLVNAGRLFATPSVQDAFPSVTGNLFRTNAIASFPGNSGGPLFVRYDDGIFYPAGIYLGGTAETVVRAVDSALIALMNRAQVSGNGGGNNTSSGVSLVNSGLSGSLSNAYGGVYVLIQPPEAVTLNARWTLSTDSTPRRSGQAALGLSASTYQISFTAIPGYATPAPISATVFAGAETLKTVTYAPLPPSITSAADRTGIKGTPFTHQIATDSTVTTFGLTGTLPTGLTFSAATGRITGTPSVSGSFTVSISAGNSNGTAMQSLRIKIPPQITNATTLFSLTQSQALTLQLTTPGDTIASYTAPGLPAGITLNSTGLISGTPTVSGNFVVDATATNPGGTATLRITINIAPQNTSGSAATGIVGQVFQIYQVTVKPGDTVTSYALTGTLPSGLYFLTDTGQIVGTPTVAGVFPVTVSATNAGGTAEQALTITISPILTFAKTGAGTVSPVIPSSSQRTPGESITLTATPAEGSFFAGWTGDLPSSARVLTFTMSTNHNVQAHFGTYATLKGIYTGLIPNAAATGFLAVDVTAKGSFSAALEIDGIRAKLRAAFDADGNFHDTFPNTAHTLDMHLGASGITGTLDAIPFTLTRPAFQAKINEAPQAGRYTLALPRPADPALPQGYGFASVTVSNVGSVRLNGTLGDGTPFSASGILTSSGDCAIFATPYSGKGLIAGTITFGDTLDGSLFWAKPLIPRAKRYPATFTAALAPEGARYTFEKNTPALAWPNGATLTIDALDSLPSTLGSVTLNTKNKFTITGAAVTLSLNTTSGTITGTVRDSANKPLPIHGILLQDEASIRAQVLTPAHTGPVELDAN